jgi:hypothetical protein
MLALVEPLLMNLGIFLVYVISGVMEAAVLMISAQTHRYRMRQTQDAKSARFHAVQLIWSKITWITATTHV